MRSRPSFHRPRQLRRCLALLAALALLVGVMAVPGQAARTPTPDPSDPLRLPKAAASVVDESTVPPRWRVTGDRDGWRLEWRSDEPVPIGDAAVEFWWREVRLGEARPLPDGQTFVLPVASLPGADLSSLRVTQGGVRVDDSQPRSVPETADPSAAAAAAERAFRSLPKASSDPGVPGPYSITSSTYRLSRLPIDEYPAPVEVLGRVVRPTDAPGARPLVVFLHGRHSTCYTGNRSSGDWPCRAGWKPIPSYLGYLEAQRLLASQGYVTVSVSANGINGQDWESVDGGAEARSLLVRHHLEQWADWASSGGAPFGTDLVGAVDMDRVLLVGHSRGGEGVNRAALDSVGNPQWSISGQVLIGPTAFGRQSQPGLNTVVLLPFCDGDVSDLQGQQYVDQSRDVVDDTDLSLRSAVMVMGANHNYFNRQWTPGESRAPSWDDWGGQDPLCGKSSPPRLSPEEQRDVGSTYIAAAANVFTEGNRAQLPLIDGSPLRAASADPAVVQVTALGANRTPVYLPAEGDATTATGSMASRVCLGWGPRQTTCARHEQSPHFLPMTWTGEDPAPYAWDTGWDRAAGRATVQLAQPADLSGSSELELRVAPEPGTGTTSFTVRMVDGAGTREDMGAVRVRPLPSSSSVSHLWARTVRLPLAATAVDVSDITRIVLVPESRSGHLFVLDMHGRSPGLDTVQPQPLPRLDVVDAEVLEGNQGDHVVDVRVDVQGTITVPVQFWMGINDDSGAMPSESSVVTLSPGDTHLDVPVHVDGNERDGYDSAITVTLRALHEAVTGHYVGTLRVLDDDPDSQATVTPTASAEEGQPLTWTISLDRPSDRYMEYYFSVAPPADGLTELMTDDVASGWLKRCGRIPHSPTPLSDARVHCGYVGFSPGDTERSLIVRTRADSIVEGDEHMAWELEQADPEPPDAPWTLVGTVSDPA